MSPVFADRLMPNCRILSHAVSMWGETVITLQSHNYFPGVSLFHDFCGIAAPNLSRRFRLRVAQLQPLVSEKHETAEQRPIAVTKVKACLFRPALKQRETACNSQRAASAKPTVLRSMLRVPMS